MHTPFLITDRAASLVPVIGREDLLCKMCAFEGGGDAVPGLDLLGILEMLVDVAPFLALLRGRYNAGSWAESVIS